MTPADAIVAIAIGLAAGVLSGLFGVGGGIVMTPAMDALLPVVLDRGDRDAAAGHLPDVDHRRGDLREGGPGRPSRGHVDGRHRSAGRGRRRARHRVGRPRGLAPGDGGAARLAVRGDHPGARGGPPSSRPPGTRGSDLQSSPRSAWRPASSRGSSGSAAGSSWCRCCRGGAGCRSSARSGTSLLTIPAIVIPGTIVHALLGNIDWWVALFLTIGAVPGARIGAKLALGSGERTLRLTVGTGMLAVAALYAVSRCRTSWVDGSRCGRATPRYDAARETRARRARRHARGGRRGRDRSPCPGAGKRCDAADPAAVPVELHLPPLHCSPSISSRITAAQDPLDDLRIEVSFGPHIESRGDYASVLTTGPDTTIASVTEPVRGEVGPGNNRTIDMSADLATTPGIDQDRLPDLPGGRAAADRRHRARLARDAGDLSGSTTRGADAVRHVGATPAPIAFGAEGPWWIRRSRAIGPGGASREALDAVADATVGRHPHGPMDLVIDPMLVTQARESPTAIARATGPRSRATRPRHGRRGTICGRWRRGRVAGGGRGRREPVREPAPARHGARRADGIARRTAGQW